MLLYKHSVYLGDAHQRSRSRAKLLILLCEARNFQQFAGYELGRNTCRGAAHNGFLRL